MGFLLILSIVAFTTLEANGAEQVEVSKHKDTDWNMLMMTQTWPPAVCIYVENLNKKCNISSNIPFWMIHGLWPTERGTEGPNFCNDTWKFDLSKVQGLRPRLDWNWPSIMKGEEPQDSWTHEWDKHGTCGVSLSDLKDEVDYFNVTLGLHDHFNLSLILMNGGINPSEEKSYNAEDVLTILQKSLGAYPFISCVKDKKNEKFYLEQIEICLTTTFKPTDCQSTKGAPLQGHGKLDSLLFQSEALLRGGGEPSGLQSNIHGCGSEGIYYKPMPPKKRPSHG